MANLKPGGLALVIKSIIPENVGIVVELVEHAGKQLLFHSMTYPDCWVVKSQRTVRAAGALGYVQTPECLCPTANLMPIDEENPDQSIVKIKDLENVK